MSLKKKLSIITINYKSAVLLRKCLFSLEEKGFFNENYEIIVINNDVDEKIEETLRDLIGNKKIKLINHRKNIGFGAGMNLGAREARGDILWFLNPDCEIIEGEINKILNHLTLKNGILGVKLVNENNKTQEWIAGKETNVLDLFLNNLGIKRSKKIWKSSKKTKCDWVTGASLFVKRSLFEKLNGFDEGFFMYFEDMDFCKRVRQLGHEVFFYPKFKIKHIGGGSYSKKSLQKKHFYKSQYYYFKKNNKKSAFLIRFFQKVFLNN